MEILNKKLKKALDNYNMGQYEAALKQCEKILEKEYSNEEALYLEGEILYKLDRVDDAIVTWKINSEYNNNKEAIDRLNNVDKDKRERALSYTNIQNMGEEIQKALMESEKQKNEKLLAENEIDKAHESKNIKEETIVTEIPISSEDSSNEVAESIDENKVVDFPNTQANEEQKTKEQPREYVVVDSNIDDVMSITRSHEKPVLPDPDIDLEELKNRIKHLDGNQNKEKEKEEKDSSNLDNKTENIIKENVKEDSTKNEDIKEDVKTSTPSKKPSKKAIITTVAAAAVIVVAISYVGLSSKSKASAPIKETAPTTQAKPETTPAKPEPTKPEPAKPQVLNETEAKALSDNMQYLLSVNSVDGLNTVLHNTPKDTVPESIMPEYNKVVQYMQTTGLNYYYENGMQNYNDGNYLDAIQYFKKGLPYATEAYRGPTMAYLIGESYYKLDDYTQAMDAFKKFLATYPNSDSYTAEVMYNLAMYYNTHGDKAQAKKYATMITEKQANSMYNNSNIKDILNEK